MIHKVAHPLSRCVKRCRHIGRHRVRVVKKLDKSKVRWIIRQKEASMSTRQISDYGNLHILDQRLWVRYRHINDAITYPAQMGRPANGLPDHREYFAVLSAYCKHRYGAIRIEGPSRLMRGAATRAAGLVRTVSMSRFCASRDLGFLATWHRIGKAWQVCSVDGPEWPLSG